ncbi:hypothetical protein GGX14DRAFT_383488 [Mycena pura]|uniref:USP8 dimerisation domain-containing protein n=1 Tax=Mycena pura TaxID=153505 RepID=A0AAD6UKB2_9AGAR|nr:hypothetical protein GGX14DRAFT_383488 [Mycena pura]
MPPAARPATISELAAAAKADPDAASPAKQPLKYYLRRAETHKSGGKALAHDAGLDLERAFIEYARAATLIVETIPSHRDYATELTEPQRENLTAVSTNTCGCKLCGHGAGMASQRSA